MDRSCDLLQAWEWLLAASPLAAASDDDVCAMMLGLRFAIPESLLQCVGINCKVWQADGTFHKDEELLGQAERL